MRVHRGAPDEIAPSAYPLVAHAAAGSVVGWRAGEPHTVRDFLVQARSLAASLPAGRHVVNTCSDRYRFALGLAACLLSQKVSLLPATRTPQVIAQLAHFAPDVFCLTDERECRIDLPRVHFETELRHAAAGEPCEVPHLPADRLVAFVFTSGSSGAPVPHPKTWGTLVRGVRTEAARLGLQAPHNLVATVPPQHMYGFESSVLLALQSGSALSAAHPFYPADVADALEGVPAPRVLITTPVHLRALLAGGSPLPATALIISATAPLSRELASEVEQRFGARLLEIYGTTETGQMASRRPACEPDWHLWPGVQLVTAGGRTIVRGGHIEADTPLNDVVESVDAEHFRLLGRLTDLVNIAGKRSSLSYLTHQLLAVPGVHDAVFFHLPAGADPVARVAAVAVAPRCSRAELLAALRQRIDPVFLPRPLLLVPALPRNSTGKLPRDELEALARAALLAARAGQT